MDSVHKMFRYNRSANANSSDNLLNNIEIVLKLLEVLGLFEISY